MAIFSPSIALSVIPHRSGGDRSRARVDCPAELLRRREQLSRTITRWFKPGLNQILPCSIVSIRSHLIATTFGTTTAVTTQLSFTGLAGNLRLEDTQLFAYPGEERLYVADLWLTHGPQTKLGIRQYWHRTTDNEWQIVKEFSIPPNG